MIKKFPGQILLGIFAMVLAVTPVVAVVPQNPKASSKLEIRAGFTKKKSVTPTELISFQLNRPIGSDEGALAVFLGQTDLTQLFDLSAKSLNYSSQSLPLPIGENPLIIYLVSPAGDWKELARFSLRVQTAATKSQPGSEKNWYGQMKLQPALTVGLKSQSAVLYYPTSERPDRINSTDVTVQGSLGTTSQQENLKASTQFDFVGTSVQKEALRFSDLENEAPQIDLSSYRVQIEVKKLKISLGHNSYGSNRYLINGFSSRGINLTTSLGAGFDLSFNAANGTSIVGWNNFTGLTQQKHNVIAGSLGYEVFKETPGKLRFEAGVLRGSLLPQNNFNQRTITDAEVSNGFGARLVTSDSSGRFRLEAGYGRSRFDNPTDPLLNQTFTVVPARETTRNAHYLELTYQLIKDFSVTKNRKANLSFNFRHNRVDPLFRSVAVSTQADHLENAVDATASIGDITATVGYNRFDDNLDDVPSILKTLTRRSGFNLGVPTTSLFSTSRISKAWLPRLSYNYERTHAFGAFLPVNSGFALTHVPDQASVNHGLNADWQYEKITFGYRFSRSSQDNREIGRERSDFRALVNSFTFSFSPMTKLNLSFDLSSERATNIEVNRLDDTLRTTFTGMLQTTKKSNLSATISTAFGGDAANTNQSRNADLDLQWSWRFNQGAENYKKVQGQFFIRYANRYSRATDYIFLFSNITKLQTLSAGLSFTFF
jgi:hypothetical protein